MTVLLLTTPRARPALEPLVDAWAAEARPVHVETCTGRPPAPTELADLATSVAAQAVLVVGPRSYAPRTALPGPVITTDDARVVPVAWLPDVGVGPLHRFALAAAAVHARADPENRVDHLGRTLAVLGQRHGRFDDLAGRILRLVDEQTDRRARDGFVLRSVRWTAYDLHRDDLAAALALGPALAVYVGHGRPSGWAGYAGTRAVHLGPDGASTWEPGAVVLSLSCNTSSRYRIGVSFAEAMPLQGVAAAALGAVRPTSHLANARWALRLTRAAASAATVGHLVAAVAPHDPAAAAYRLLGDPTAPLWDAGTMSQYHDQMHEVA